MANNSIRVAFAVDIVYKIHETNVIHTEISSCDETGMDKLFVELHVEAALLYANQHAIQRGDSFYGFVEANPDSSIHIRYWNNGEGAWIAWSTTGHETALDEEYREAVRLENEEFAAWQESIQYPEHFDDRPDPFEEED